MPDIQFIKGKGEFSVGDEKLDSQHHKIIEIINTLYIAIQEKESSTINSVLSELHEYTKTHFVYEENLMKKYWLQW